MIPQAVVLDQVTGFKKVIFDAGDRVSGRNAMPFENIEQVQNWLEGGEQSPQAR